MDAAERVQTERVVGLVRQVLGDAVLGIYLHGSGASGELRPESDIDLFAVTSRPTTDAERRRLIECLLPISGPGDPTGRSRPIELAMVVQGDVRPWRYPPRLDFQYGDWHRAEFARGNFTPWDEFDPDLALVIEMVRQADHPLLGPSPRETLDPIPPADIRRAQLDSVPVLLGYLDGDERNVVLTFVRIWSSLATGTFRSKDAAAEWATPLLPEEHRAVLRHARAMYLGETPEEWGALLPRVRPCVDHVIFEIEGVAVALPPDPPLPGGSAPGTMGR